MYYSGSSRFRQDVLRGQVKMPDRNALTSSAERFFNFVDGGQVGRSNDLERGITAGGKLPYPALQPQCPGSAQRSNF